MVGILRGGTVRLTQVGRRVKEVILQREMWTVSRIRGGRLSVTRMCRKTDFQTENPACGSALCDAVV